MIASSIILLHLTLNGPRLASQSFWLDETFTVFYAQQPISRIVARATYDQNPPLYVILVRFWIRSFGDSEAAVRSFSLLSSALAIAATFAFARRFLDERTSFASAILLTVSSVHAYYAREARSYALVELLSVVSFYACCALVERPTRCKLAVLAAVNALLLYTHFAAVFVLLVQVLWVVASRRGAPKRKLAVGLAVAGGLILFLPWLRFVYANLPVPGRYWLARPDLDSLFSLLCAFAGSRALLLADAVIILGVIVASRSRNELPVTRDEKLLLLALWAFVPIAGDYALSQLVPMFRERYVLYASIGLILLTTYSLSRINPGNTAFAIVLSALLVLSLRALELDQRKPDWRAAIADLGKARSSNDLVIVSPSWQNLPFAYYYDRSIFRDYEHLASRLGNDSIIAANEASEIDRDRLDNAGRLIFVLAHDAKLAPGFVRDVVGRGSRQLRLLDRADFSGLEILVLQPADRF